MESGTLEMVFQNNQSRGKEMIQKETMITIYKNKLIKLLQKKGMVSPSHSGYTIAIQNDLKFEFVEGLEMNTAHLETGGEYYTIDEDDPIEGEVFREVESIIEKFRDDIFHKKLGNIEL